MRTNTKTADPIREIKRDGDIVMHKAAFNPLTEQLMSLGFSVTHFRVLRRYTTNLTAHGCLASLR